MIRERGADTFQVIVYGGADPVTGRERRVRRTSTAPAGKPQASAGPPRQTRTEITPPSRDDVARLVDTAMNRDAELGVDVDAAASDGPTSTWRPPRSRSAAASWRSQEAPS